VAVRLDGKPKIMLFVAHWCPHCQVEIPRLAGWLPDHPLPGDVEVVTVSTGVEANRPNYPPSTWLEREGWTYPTLADSATGDAAKAYGLSAFPYFVAVDKGGRVVARDTGELSTGQFSDLVDLAWGA
jgi:cytochrome c biogenesis protein CcmG, thiol:disulfide interchange protein DsbE